MKHLVLLAVVLTGAADRAPSTGVRERVHANHEERVPGVVRPIRWVRVSSETDGRIVERRVDEHERVEKGALVLAIEDRLKRADVVTAKAALLDARAGRDLARANLTRAKELMTHDVSSRVELERAVAAERSAEAAVMAAEAQLATAEFHLEKTRIISPIAGFISRIDVEQDELVRPGLFVFSVMDVEEVKIESYVRDDLARRLAAGQAVEVDVAGRVVTASVRSVAPGTDNESRTFKVVLTAKNVAAERGLLLRPGTTVRWWLVEQR